MGGVVKGKGGGFSERIFRVRGKRMLNGLSFERTENPKPYRATDRGTQLTKNKQTHARMTVDLETRQDRAEDRRQVAAGGSQANAEGSFGRAQESRSLRATGAVRDVVGREYVKGRIKLGKTIRLKVGMRDKWQ